VQNTRNTITNGIMAPIAIAVDGIGNILVQNDFSNITMYGQSYGFASPATLQRTFAPQFPIYGIAVSNGTFVFGGNSAVHFASELQVLISGNYSGGYTPNSTGFAIAGDKFGNFYVADLNGTVRYAVGGGEAPFVQLSYSPWGVAVDNVNGRVYFSNSNANTIDVYSINGVLLHTIH